MMSYVYSITATFNSFARLIIIVGASMFTLLSCKGKDDTPGPSRAVDKEIRFFAASGVFSNYDIPYEGTKTTDPKIVKSILLLINKDNYADIDSIVYVIDGINVIEQGSGSPGNKASGNLVIELYDMTNKKVIENSRIMSGNTDNKLVSKNLLNYLPNQSIDLGFKISSDSEKNIVYTGIIYLLFYRKN